MKDPNSIILSAEYFTITCKVDNSYKSIQEYKAYKSLNFFEAF